jgi:hypothetical protein
LLLSKLSKKGSDKKKPQLKRKPKELLLKRLKQKLTE